MTRKHYVQIAANFARRMDQFPHAMDPESAINAAYRIAVRDCIIDLCEVLKSDNPRFDADRFKSAAGFYR